MKSPALFTAIILGATATVTAQPKREPPPKQEENGGRVRLDDKKPAPQDAPRSVSDWIELASPTPAKHGTQFVIVGTEAGAFSRIRLDAAKGKTIVRYVKIFFDDGKLKTVRLDSILSEKGRNSAFVELGSPKAIDRIVIHTEPHTSGEYVIYGASGANAASTP
jgi:hypothetical protein